MKHIKNNTKASYTMNAGLPYLRLYQALLDDPKHVTLEREHWGSIILLMMACLAGHGVLPQNPKALARIAQCTVEELDDLKSVWGGLVPHPNPDQEGMLTIMYVLDEIQAVEDVSATRKVAAQIRWAKPTPEDLVLAEEVMTWEAGKAYNLEYCWDKIAKAYNLDTPLALSKVVSDYVQPSIEGSAQRLLRAHSALAWICLTPSMRNPDGFRADLEKLFRLSGKKTLREAAKNYWFNGPGTARQGEATISLEGENLVISDAAGKRIIEGWEW